MTIDLDRAALLVVDVQNGFITQDSAPVVPTISDLAAAWAAAGRPAMFTRYLNYPGSPYERLIGWTKLHASPETDLVDELTPHAAHPTAHVLDKVVYTALTAEGSAHLASLRVTDLVICGIATDGCIFKTALDAFEQGFTPWVIRDAVASNASRHPAPQIHESALVLIGRLIGANQLVESAEVLSALKSRF